MSDIDAGDQTGRGMRADADTVVGDPPIGESAEHRRHRTRVVEERALDWRERHRAGHSAAQYREAQLDVPEQHLAPEQSVASLRVLDAGRTVRVFAMPPSGWCWSLSTCVPIAMWCRLAACITYLSSC